MFCTCRHGYLLRAVDMRKGETYRHVHYLHDYAYRTGCKFVCYDVVCKYWSFAEDLSEAIEEFKFHTQKMEPFLSRWHGKTHAWYCQVCYFVNLAKVLIIDPDFIEDFVFRPLDGRGRPNDW